MIYNAPEAHISDILHKGIVDGIRKALKTRLMNELEKDIDGAVEDATNKLKGVIEYHYSHLTDKINFNIMLNGKPVPTRNT
jgi:hypothetical protein